MENFAVILLIFLSSFNTYILIRTFKPKFLFRRPSKKELELIEDQDVSGLSASELKTFIFRKIGKNEKQILVEKISTYLKNILKFGPLLLFSLFSLRDYILYSISIFLSFTISKSCKRYIKKTRPDELNERSFPSGHTASAFVGSSFIYYLYGINFFTIILFALSIFVGYSRLAAKRHTFLDVFGGFFLGFFSGFIAPSLLGYFFR